MSSQWKIANIKQDERKLNRNVERLLRVYPCQVIASLQDDVCYAKYLFDKEMNLIAEVVRVELFSWWLFILGKLITAIIWVL